MTWADEDECEKREYLRVALTGGKEWGRLQEKIFAIVDVIATRIQNQTLANPSEIDNASETMKDITKLAANWARAKIEKPSLENEKLKAEIASEFAEAKKRWAEANKIEAETRQINSNVNSQELVSSLDNLERLLKLASAFSQISFARVDGNAHLIIGPSSDVVGEPDGDQANLEDSYQDDMHT